MKSMKKTFANYWYSQSLEAQFKLSSKDTVEKNVTDETSEAFLIKIFKRHDKDKDGLLNKEGRHQGNI